MLKDGEAHEQATGGTARFHEKPELTVLRLIDDETAIANALSLDGFLGGFALAWKLTTE